MRRRVLVVIGALAASACSADQMGSPVQPESLSVPLRVTEARGGANPNHSVHLSGDQEVLTVAPGAPHPSDSNAQGQAIFQIAADGQSFDYKLIASNIENIVQAHIHCGPAGVNGPIVVWLYPSPSSTAALTGPTERHDGVLVEGTVNNTVDPPSTDHVTPTTAAACPGGVASFADVLARLREGNAYVNIHTNDGVAPTNTGPGDFPGGEVRGQFKN